jgi:hypothetical protein
LFENSTLERTQRRPRLEAELLHEPTPARLIGREGVGLPAGAEETEHQLADQPLPERVRADEPLELAHQLCAASQF